MEDTGSTGHEKVHVFATPEGVFTHHEVAKTGDNVDENAVDYTFSGVYSEVPAFFAHM